MDYAQQFAMSKFATKEDREAAKKFNEVSARVGFPDRIDLGA